MVQSDKNVNKDSAGVTRKAPTLRDVAAAAGVDKTTVSVVLNGNKSGTRVSDATRLRIQAAAAELCYQANAVARSLRRQSTNCIGFYRYAEHGPLYARDPFNAAIIDGMSAECHRQHKDFMIHVSTPRIEVDDVYLELTNGRVDGLVLLPMRDDPLAARLAESHVPAVAVADATPALPSVTVDDAAGARMLVAHLAEKGHRRIVYRNEPHGFTSTQRRLKAFLEAADEHGLEVTVTSLTYNAPYVRDHEIPLWSKPGAERPTAIVCCSDLPAHRVLGYCRKAGMRVPDDLAVVGFDGLPTDLELAYQLTTVRAPWDQVAETAVRIIIDCLDGREAPPETMLPVLLVVGNTT